MIFSSFLLLMFCLNKFIAHCCWCSDDFVKWFRSHYTRIFTLLINWHFQTFPCCCILSASEDSCYQCNHLVWCLFILHQESTWASSALFAVDVQTTKVTLLCCLKRLERILSQQLHAAGHYKTENLSDDLCKRFSIVQDSFQLRLPEQYNLQYMLKAAWAIFNKGID